MGRLALPQESARPHSVRRLVQRDHDSLLALLSEWKRALMIKLEENGKELHESTSTVAPVALYFSFRSVSLILKQVRPHQ